MKYLKKLFLFFGMICLIGNIVSGNETLAAYYENDVTPPWGRVHVEKSVKVDGTTYVGETPVNVKIYAKDDFCTDDEIKYYISTSPISNTTKLDTWYNYEAGKIHEITLDENGTGNVYTIFKDANGNTSLTYEVNANTSQTVIFDSNGGEAIPTEVNTSRTYGMPYILPVQEPYKRGEYFLGWSTDKNANVGSYRQGDVIPPDASLGNEDEVTLYAIYGTDLEKMPDLIDVVEIGDYVNYPVEYENVVTKIDATDIEFPEYTSKLNGWRVMNKNIETGEIQLVSAGVPLTLFKEDNSNASTMASIMASTTDFLNIGFTTNQTDGKFRKNGFNRYNSLIDAFTNKYTVINSEVPEVRSITKGDVNIVYQYFGGTGTTSTETYLNKPKYRELLGIPSQNSDLIYAYYWLATEYNGTLLWGFNGMGGNLFNNEDSDEYERGVRPVVTLKPNIKATGKDLDGAWNIEVEEKVVQKPDGRTYAYTGTEQTFSFKNYDSRYIELSGTTKGTDIGTYTAIAKLKEPENYTWADGTTEDKEIPWEIREFQVGDYIEYGIEYTDVYTNYEFSGDYGWRILSKTNNGDGTSNIEIISTGVPARLYYSYSYIDSAVWCANSAQRAQYKTDYYISSSVNNANVKAAAGLLYNFENIEFVQGTSATYSKGYYTLITGNQNSENGLFKSAKYADKELKVRSVMHADINGNPKKELSGTLTDKATGLFTLQNLVINPHTSDCYWLASPSSSAGSGTAFLTSIYYNGNVRLDDGNAARGVRPVVSISNVKLELVDNAWKIK